MKKLTAVAVALMAATSAAQAAEVFKNERQSVDLYGRVYAGQFMGTKEDGTQESSDKIGANQFIRFGAKADAAITGTMKAVAQYEVQMYINGSEKINNGSCDKISLTGEAQTITPVCKDENLRTRLAYAGVKSDNFGQVTFGRQKGAVAMIADWTDVALSDGYGTHGLGAGSDTFATGRASDVLKYSGKFLDDAFLVDASYKFDGNKVEETTKADADAAYGLAAAYTLPMGLGIGTGYNVGNRDKAGEEDAKLWVIGAMYDDKTIYAALNYADGSDFVATGTDHTGWEAALGYNFDNGFGLMALYNKQELDNGTKTDKVDYYTLGAQYKFNKQLRVIGEYRMNNLDDLSATKNEKTKDDYQLAVRYDF